MGTPSAKGLCVNKEQRFDTMGACLQTTPLTDTLTKEPVNGTEARARPHTHVHAHTHTHVHPQERIEQCVVTHRDDV